MQGTRFFERQAGNSGSVVVCVLVLGVSGNRLVELLYQIKFRLEQGVCAKSTGNKSCKSKSGFKVASQPLTRLVLS